MKKILLFLCTSLLSISIFSQTVNCENIYQIEIPNDMYLIDANPDAIFEIANYIKEQYLQVFHESRLDFKKALGSSEKSLLSDYTNLLKETYEEALNGKGLISELPFKNYNAKKITLRGSIDGVPAVWHTICIETELYMYQIIYWTLEGESERENLQKLFNTAKTFQEL